MTDRLFKTEAEFARYVTARLKAEKPNVAQADRVRTKQAKGRIVRPVGDSDAPRGKMNGLETQYVNEVLQPRKYARAILDFWYEPIRFRMAKNVNYTGDFVVRTASGQWQLHEVKGYKFPAAWVRFKVCAEMEPFSLMFDFYLCRKIHGVWNVERVGE